MDLTRYETLRRGASIAPLPPRTHIDLTGRDRATLLNGLCTNDIRRLASGQSCEAFLTNVQGKTIGHIYVHCRPDSLALETIGGQAETILEQLQRYQIREDVLAQDRSADVAEFLVAGDDAARWLGQLLGTEVPPAGGNDNWELHGRMLSLRHVPFAREPSFFVCCAKDDLDAVLADCWSAGALDGGQEWADVARIEAGTPLFGIDLTADTLPQEVNRNQQAISFTKGCYLGQETIARLDARGHVNRLWVGLRCSGPQPPAPGTLLVADGKPVARVTSSCWSASLQAPLALAYVRRGFETAGTVLRTEPMQATVISLPV
jgi:folate-binding protein YgfZ